MQETKQCCVIDSPEAKKIRFYFRLLMTTVSICPITILYLSQYASTTLDLEAKDSTTHPETK